MYKDFKLNRNLNKCKIRDLSFLNVDIQFLFKKKSECKNYEQKSLCLFIANI